MSGMKKAIVKSPLEILEVIGHHLKQLRLAKGYTSQEDFAFDHDLPRVQYWRMEKGVANLTFRSLAKVLAIHGLTIEEFFTIILEKRQQSEIKN